MTNKLKIFYCLMLCFLVYEAGTQSIAAQTTDKVVVGAGKHSLKQSEFNRLVEFYEWLFAVQFTSDERERFQEFVAADFRRSAAAARKNVEEVFLSFDKVRALDANGQNKTRELAAPNFIADLQQTANEPDSQFLLEIYQRGQNGASGETTADTEVLPLDEDTTDSPKSSAGNNNAGSASLVGRWLKSGGAGGARDHTGKTLYNSGNDFIFEFFADGTMRFINEKNTLSITQCRISETTKISGKYTVSGSTVTMKLGAGTSVGTNSCQSSGNFKKTLSASTLQKKFVVKRMESIFRPDAPWILCFDGSKDNDCFEKNIK